MDTNKDKNVVKIKLNEKFKDSKNRTIIIVTKGNVNDDVITKEKREGESK